MFAALIRRGGRRRRAARDEFAQESTLFSLSTEVPRPDERRSDDRMAVILPLARLIAGERQDFCRIRNISAGGLMAEAMSEHDVGTPVEIELHSDHRIAGTIAWTRGGNIGVKFEENVDLRALLVERRAVGVHAPRPPRLEIACGATVRIGQLYHQVSIRDISLGGMKVEINDWNCVGKEAHVTLESFRTIKGRVRWFKGGRAGIVFDRPLTFDELARWLGKRVEIASLKAGAWERG